MRRLLLVLPIALLLVVVGVGLFSTRPVPTLGEQAPSFELPTLADPDTRLHLESLRDRPVVLNFWASWCDPCRDEAPHFAEVARRFSSVAFLGVNILDGREEALAYVEEFDIPYPSVRDANGSVADTYEVTGAPETFFIDPAGNIVGTFVGALSGEQLVDLVGRLSELSPGDVLDVTGRGETRPVP